MIREPYGTWLVIRPLIYSKSFLGLLTMIVLQNITSHTDTLSPAWDTLFTITVVMGFFMIVAQYSTTIRSWYALNNATGDDLKEMLIQGGLGISATLVAQAIPVMLGRKERAYSAQPPKQWEKDRNLDTSSALQRTQPISEIVGAWLRRYITMWASRSGGFYARIQNVISTTWQHIHTQATGMQEYSISSLLNVSIHALTFFAYKQVAIRWFCKYLEHLACTIPELRPCIDNISAEYEYNSKQEFDETLLFLEQLNEKMKAEKDQHCHPPTDDTFE